MFKQTDKLRRINQKLWRLERQTQQMRGRRTDFRCRGKLIRLTIFRILNMKVAFVRCAKPRDTAPVVRAPGCAASSEEG
ncbi:hypothetical protein JI721_04465 [Alicyclobacillus cycloheptanicus]|uniref:Uncharacterized protein n=1 Tax=Alicyclobacillus cycloheptanicus TaxID=1457 RepID=A0ABT9XK61_9BACL|nr:hypothetical protein [Alicyclobacillus cycloheptanicus]MDQ0190111.1 hypothetical protein [Alicyclobacillus cycloheptanicus]WDM02083.1 hypothetical protein JI721_04465 [Alicyclobacillus cycloheptanicus]